MMTLCIIVAVMFFMVYVERGRERQILERCFSCGARYGEKHHRDCQFKEKP